ncbi:CcoQ/FixQ family Cbb3-type cytochrome c oxidase assembly chaperone [Paralimibaculum aggregatum]|uniref:CcoQ/FixQ family Cbb3-type cytochrome c oxidase assembly chaperone n=1 Tax=Paralimibaculum aggregatum TaxID=3036245 RepID=A0ABQ6LPV6_9RHOB|nr:cbb3-type cytochrome c oxidase subunit 3 [Limibaculum sp. NKW23]GMG84656.1 CcoQ/FixQ family Cbb3-type cytochrome c oxidase assembly chaperone [Limibaculum sp. NKW23]
MDTYSLLRQFADSWWLLVMTAFFLGVVVFTLRPGSRRVHDDIANIPLRNDEPKE